MLEARCMPARLQYGEVAAQVGVFVGEGLLQRIADPRLGGQVHDPAGAGLPQQVREGLGVGHVHAHHAEAGMLHQGGGSRLLEGRVVVGVELVHPHDLLAAFQQAQGGMASDEAGRAGDDDQGGPLRMAVAEDV